MPRSGATATTASMASRLADKAATLGSACACSRTRSSWHKRSAMRRVSSITSIESGLPSGAIGSAESTTILVSLLMKTSSMKWLIEKQARGSASPQFCCGKRLPEPRPAAGRRVQVVLEEVTLDVEDELVAGDDRACDLGVRRRRAGDAERATGRWTSGLLGGLLGARVEGQERGGCPADREQELPAGEPGAAGGVVTVPVRSGHGLAHQRREWLRLVLAVRAGPELDRQSRVVVAHVA